MTNTEWWEKINFSVAWEIPRKGNLIIQYLPTLLKAKTLLGYIYKKKSKVGCDNKQAKDSKKNGYLNFASVCGWGGTHKENTEAWSLPEQMGAVSDLINPTCGRPRTFWRWVHHLHGQLKSFHPKCLWLKAFPGIKLQLDVNDTTGNRMRQPSVHMRLGLIKGVSPLAHV